MGCGIVVALFDGRRVVLEVIATCFELLDVHTVSVCLCVSAGTVCWVICLNEMKDSWRKF